MPDDVTPNDRTFPLSTASRHSQLCSEFEKAWHEGRRPRIEDWLAKVPEEQRPDLFCSLAKLEQQLRNHHATIDEFRRRFPAFGTWIETFFHDDTSCDIDLEQEVALPTIPGYQILERIALGGMGVVYKANQLGLDRVVALKMVRGKSWHKDSELTRFKIEARAVAGLDHPHIVRIYDFGEHESLPYFTMEYVDGGSLSQRLIAAPPNFRETAGLLETIARAVQVVHHRQIVHRDLKPGNILLSKDGTPKISDFGLAKRLGADQSVTLTGAVMGTANYMSPEQARGDKQIGPAVDIYALGAILYECLTGEPPFRDESYEKTLRRVTDEEPKRPRELIALIPPELEAICLKCLDKDPAQRYAKADDVADDLRRYLNGDSLSIGTFNVIEQHARWARKLGYDNLDMLGCTQWAFVYRAREVMINRQVVLKLSTGGSAHERLRRQAEAMADLGHPNLEHLYRYDEHHGQPYLVHEYVDGRSLSVVMRERALDPEAKPPGGENDPSAEVAPVRLPARKAFSPVSAALAAEWVKMLARALQFIHEHDALHSAIYPGEIRLTPSGVPKLCGFGAAQKIVAKNGPLEASATWVRPNYQPPEQLSGDWQALSPASDVYSLGTVLYELLTGQAPFFGSTMQETREAVMREMPVAPRNLNPRIPSLLDSLCQRCLAKNATDRIRSAAEMAECLERYLQALNTTEEETANFDSCSIFEPATGGDYELRIYPNGRRTPVDFPLPRRWVSIGRSTDSDIVIQDDFCSRNHCAIFWDDKSSQHVLIIIKAKHGVQINSQNVSGSQALVPGDTIQIASTRIVFDCKPKS